MAKPTGLIRRTVCRGSYADAVKFLMSLYVERSSLNWNGVGSRSPFVGEVLKIDFGFDRFFAPARPKHRDSSAGTGCSFVARENTSVPEMLALFRNLATIAQGSMPLSVRASHAGSKLPDDWME
jgi:hypothetical protein